MFIAVKLVCGQGSSMQGSHAYVMTMLFACHSIIYCVNGCQRFFKLTLIFSYIHFYSTFCCFDSCFPKNNWTHGNYKYCFIPMIAYNIDPACSKLNHAMFRLFLKQEFQKWYTSLHVIISMDLWTPCLTF